MTTMPGPSSSTAAVRPPRAAKTTPDTRQIQRRWISLIDSWRSTYSNQPAFGTPSRDEMVEEISHHAQVLCRTIKDRSWLIDAFQLATNAVLFPTTQTDDEEELVRVDQLGRQMLQLAIHSVAAPFEASLTDQSEESKQVEKVKVEWERLARRLGVYGKLKGLQKGLPVLPLTMVLEEPESTILLCLALLPDGASVVGTLLKSEVWLVDESAPVRLQILKQLLATAPGRERYASMAASGLLIGWRDDGESGIWASAQSKLRLEEIVESYKQVLSGLRQSGAEQQAEALVETMATDWSGEDAQRALAQLRSQTQPSTSAARHVQAAQRFDLSTIQTLATQVSGAGSNEGARKQLAQHLASTHDATTLAQRITQLIDTHDSLTVRSFALDIAAQAGSVALLACILYARPAVGRDRLGLGTPVSLITQAEAVIDGLSLSKPVSGSSRLADALHTSLGLDLDSAVPACQLFALLQSDNDTVVELARKHLSWLRAVMALVEGQSDKPRYDLCWMAAFGGDGSDSKQQMEAFEALLESFNRSHPVPATGGKTDAAVLRFRAAWDAAFHRLMELTSATGPFALVDQGVATERLLSRILRTGDVELFRSLSSTLPTSKVESLVLQVSTSLFDSAPIASTRDPHIRLSLDILSALAASTAKAQRNFIEAACRLASFKIKSISDPSQSMTPREIRSTPDKVHLISRLLATQADAHRSPELVLDVANRLACPLNPAERVLVEARTLAMLADSAITAEEFQLASSFCQRLIDHVASVRRPTTCAAQIVEIAWKTCFQLSKHPDWQDTPGRITMLSHAMTLAPPTQLGVMLRQWNMLDEQLVGEVEGGKVFDSKKAGWPGVAGGGGGGGGISAQTAASVGAGLVGTAANLLPLSGLSFSPLSYFGTSANTNTNTNTNTTTGNAASKVDGEVDARTAKLFDFDNVSGASGASGGGYVDPTERAVRAARAARDFLGWREGDRKQQPSGGEGGGGGGGGGGGFSFSRGMGWLMGDGEGR